MLMVCRILLILVLANVLVLVSGAIEQANSQAQNQTSIVQGQGPSSEQVFDQVIGRVDPSEEFDATGWPPHGRFTLSPEGTQAYVDFNKRLWARNGMAYQIAPTYILQKGSQGGNQDYTANEQYNSMFIWRALNNTRIGTGYFVANYLYLSQLTDTTGVDFSQSLGINYFTSDSVSEARNTKALLWRHDFPGDFLNVLVGHDDPSTLVTKCRYACDDTMSFLSSPLSAFPTSTLPGSGTMLSADWNLSDVVTIETGVSDALGNGKPNFSRVFDNGDLAYGGSLKLENPFKSVGDGLYKFGYYKVDETRSGTSSARPAREGFSIQIDQDVRDIGFFAKYGRANKSKGSIEQYAAAGMVWTKPFGNDEDWLGLGFGWVDPTQPNSNDEYVAEAFYRMQLTPFVQVSADAMLIMNPSNHLNENTESVFSLRARGQF